MRKIIGEVILPLLIIFSSSYPLDYSRYNLFQIKKAIVQKVVDGDTIRVKMNGKTEKVRLLYLDTMELKRNKKAIKDEKILKISSSHLFYVAKEAFYFMKNRLPSGTKVVLYIPKSKPKDIYGRYLAVVIKEGEGVAINEELVKKGFARTFYLSNAPDEISNYYLLLEKTAREKECGIWRFYKK